jgi:phage terminase large subunit-like protein
MVRKAGGVEVPAEPLQADAERVLAGRSTKPRATKRQRDKRTKHDKEAGYRGLVCQSCGAVRPVDYFLRLRSKPPEYDSVCKGCRALDRAEMLKAQVEDRRIERSAIEIRKRMVKDAAKKRAKMKLVDERERARTKAYESSRRKVFKDGDEAAQVELARRELCRRHLIYFTMRFEGLELVENVDEMKETGRGYHAAWCHRLIARKLGRFLKDVVAGKEPRLQFRMPPRHGKSTLVSRMFPAFGLGHYPWLEFINGSYGASLPMEFSRYVRTLVQDPAYKVLFPKVHLAEGKKGLEGWGTTAGGQFLPAGVGTGIGGRGAHVLNIDDPVADQIEADSPTIQERNFDWYMSVAQARLAPRSGVLITQTLWNEADISVRLEKQMKDSLEEIELRYDEERAWAEANLHGHEWTKAMKSIRDRQGAEEDQVEKWDILNLPAIATADEYLTVDDRVVHEAEEGAKLVRREGEALHPERFPEKRLLRIKSGYQRSGRDRAWHALYQQDPTPAEGRHFSESSFVRESPLNVSHFNEWTIIQAWDLAISQVDKSSWTVGGTGVLDPDGVLHAVSMRRFRGGAPEIVKNVVDEYEHYQLLAASGVWRVGVEHGHISMAVIPSINAEVARRNKKRPLTRQLRIPWPRDNERLVPVTDKVVRARPSEEWHSAGRVRYPHGVGWVEVLKNEHLRFPTLGAANDCVDFMSWLVRMAQRAPVPQVANRGAGGYYRESWRDRLAGKANAGRDPMAA